MQFNTQPNNGGRAGTELSQPVPDGLGQAPNGSGTQEVIGRGGGLRNWDFDIEAAMSLDFLCFSIETKRSEGSQVLFLIKSHTVELHPHLTQ